MVIHGDKAEIVTFGLKMVVTLQKETQSVRLEKFPEIERKCHQPAKAGVVVCQYTVKPNVSGLLENTEETVSSDFNEFCQLSYEPS